MGLFNRDPKPKVPPVAPPQESIDTVKDHLNAIGQFRLELRNADMKMLASVIAQNGLPCLMRQDASGQPSLAQIVKMCELLKYARNVLSQYKEIEGRLEYARPDVQEMLFIGVTNVKRFADQLVNSRTPGGNSGLTGYVVDSQMLSL